MTSREVNVILRERLPVIQGKFPSLGEGTHNKNHLATAAMQDFRKFKTLRNLGEFFFSVLDLEPRATEILGKCSITELHSQILSGEIVKKIHCFLLFLFEFLIL